MPEMLGLGLFVQAGWIAWPMLLICSLLCYFLSLRHDTLKNPWDSSKLRSWFRGGDFSLGTDLVSVFLKRIEQLRRVPVKEAHLDLAELKQEIHMETNRFSKMVTVLVSVAPLLGLLGTVIGMIETFDALDDNALFSQSGGIAGGISQAMITTQMGLVISIPGVIVGRWLAGRQTQVIDLVEQAERLFFEDLKKEAL